MHNRKECARQLQIQGDSRKMLRLNDGDVRKEVDENGNLYLFFRNHLLQQLNKLCF